MYKGNLSNILFLDIETVPQYKEYANLPETTKNLWQKKSKFLIKNENDTAEILYEKAGIYAEFGKIICISVGFIYNKEQELYFKTKSFYDDNEKLLLNDFKTLLEKSFNSPNHLICGHNSKEFDIPYIARRMLINGIKLPKQLDIAGKKPWEISHIDTMDLWKFGDYKHYTSLELLAHCFDIPTPKDDINGSEVGKVYWEDNDLKRISKYCQKDVLTTARLFLKYNFIDNIKQENVLFN